MRQFIHESFVSRHPTETFTGTIINEKDSLGQIFIGDQSKIMALWEEFSKKTISVLIRASLPG
ncbi:hypothetical protein AZ66_27970 [Paenibacillus sp. E194]|nr:hypothetical protein AZ66_27970 [Paenibacillus sp. E194]